MKQSNTMLRAFTVGFLTLGLVILGLWCTGNYPPVALANGGGGGTTRILTKCTPTGGTITNSPTGTSFANGTVVTLTAVPNAGYAFVNWTGAVSGSTNPIQLTMNANKSVCAVFEQIKLTVDKQGNGQVSVDPPGETLTPSFTKTYGAITDVTLTAIPAAGWAFKEWTGDKTGSANPASILVNRSKTVTAVFEEIKLTVNKTGEGQVSATPPGGAQTPTFTENYGANTTVSLTAIPEPGWAFKEWTGAISSTSNPANVLVNGDKTVTAVFEEIKLTVNKTGNGQVNVAPPGETLTPSFTKTYGAITTVTLTASPDPGWAFKEWTGAISSTDNPANVLVNGDKTVTAAFVEIKLTVERSGIGDVTLNPPNVTQTPTFTQAYSSATTVTLTAVPDAAWVFKEWTGAITSTLNPVDVSVSKETTVKAVFEQRQLAVEKEGFGSVHIDPPNETLSPYFVKLYASDTNVTLTAVSDVPEWGFKEWTGDVTGTSPTVTLMVNGQKSVVAVFEKIRLTVNKEGEGAVNVDPPNQTLSPPAYKDYQANQVVTLTALPAAGWGFKEWTGAASGTSPTTTVTMDKAKSVTAVFARIKLEITKEGSGWVRVDPPDYIATPPITQYFAPANPPLLVTLTAIPQAGWGFKEWDGVKRGKEENNPLVLTMNADDSVKAIFAQVELNVDKEGEGTVSVSPPGGVQTLPYSELYAYGSNAILTATPLNESWHFTGWSGDVFVGTELNNPLNVAMTSGKEILATFTECNEGDWSAWTPTVSYPFPEPLLNQVNSVVQAIPGGSGIEIKNASFTYAQKNKSCCLEGELIEGGQLQTSGGASFGLRGDNILIPGWAIPTIEQEFDFGVAVISIEFEVGLYWQFDVGFSGEAGKRLNVCNNVDCPFWDIGFSTSIGLSAQFNALGCSDTIYTEPNCAGISITPAGISAAVTGSISSNEESCDDGMDVSLHLGEVVVYATIELFSGGSASVSWDYTVFTGAQLL